MRKREENKLKLNYIPAYLYELQYLGQVGYPQLPVQKLTLGCYSLGLQMMCLTPKSKNNISFNLYRLDLKFKV